MKVLITGGAGFLGRRLAVKLLERGSLKGADDKDSRIDQMVLVDIVQGAPIPDKRVRSIVGDIGDPDFLKSTIDAKTDSIFHLAAIVSGQAEADFDLGMRINVDASRHLLDICRGLGHRPKVVFASSVAVFGGELPAMVLDTTALTPQSSYGTQKAVIELFVNDYTRKGFIDGRVSAIADDQRAAGASERGCFFVCKRHHSRAIKRRASGLPGQREHTFVATVAGKSH